ncbi:MAG: VOC family protein [Chloroflexi bacterium]|nr:VOC family protein [Chloroflexota bacterium]
MAKLKHLAIATQDPQKTANFYKEAFDLNEVGKINSDLVEGFFLSDGHVNFAILKFKNEAVAGKEFGTSYTGIHHMGFEVDDMGDTAKRLEKLNSSPRDDINSVLNPAMKDINAAIGASMKDMVGGHGGRNVEVKFSGPDGVMIDISQTGWVGTDTE